MSLPPGEERRGDPESAPPDPAVPHDGSPTRKIAFGGLLRPIVPADTSPKVIERPLSDAVWFEPGTLLGDYEVLSEVGRGAMGVVYKARHARLNRIVALKVTRSAAGPRREESERRFLAEATAVARLDHPQIVPVYEVGEVKGYSFFAMAFVEGSTLHQAIARGPRPQRDAAELIRQVAGAIAYAHRQGVIHRDLKPENILLDSAGRPRITDFGIAKFEDETQPMTLKGEILGTPGYMAPEQAMGNAERIGPRSDVYAIGATLYCLLTGRPPFQSANPLDTLRQVLESDPVSPRKLNPAVDRDLETICLKCLENRPERRYASAQALSEDLTRYLDQQPILARPVNAAEKGVRWCRRNPLLASMIAGASAVVAAAFVLVSWSYWNATQASEEAKRHEKAERWERYRANLLSVSSAHASRFGPLVRGALDSAPPEHRNWEWHHFRNQLDGSQRVWDLDNANVPQSEFLGNAPVVVKPDRMVTLGVDAVRPQALPTVVKPAGRDHALLVQNTDGRWAFHSAGDAEWGIWDAAGARQRSKLVGESDWFRYVEFSPDGERLHALSADWRLRSWDAATGKLARTSPPLDVPRKPISVSMSGHYCLLVCSDDAGHLFDNATGKLLHVLRGPFRLLRWVAFDRQGTRILTSEPYPNNVMHLWDAHTGKKIAVMKGHRNEAAPVVFSPDGSRIASCSFDRTVRLWDGKTGAPIAKLQGHNGRVYVAAFRPDSRRLVSGSEDGTLRLWDAETGDELAVLAGHSTAIRRVHYSANGKSLLSWGDQTLRLWDEAKAERSGVLRGHTDFVYGAVFHPDGRRVVSASWDGSVRVWNASNAEEEARFEIAGKPILTAVAVHPDGRWAAVRARDNSVQLLDLKERSVAHRWKLHTDDFLDSRVAFSPRGDLVASGSKGGAVHVWETESRKEIATLPHADGTPHDLVFGPDGRWLAAGLGNPGREVRIWDPRTGETIRSLSGHSAEVYSLAVSKDGKLLASAGRDGLTILWNAETWKELGRMKQGCAVYGLALTPDGKRLAAGCEDSIIRLWDVATRQDVAELRGHADYVYMLAFSPDGTRLVSGSGDFTLRIWDTLSPAERDRAR